MRWIEYRFKQGGCLKQANSIAAFGIFSLALPTFFIMPPLFGNCCRNPQHLWTTMWRTHFCKADVKALFALEYVLVRVNVISLIIEHPNMGLGVFSTPKYRKCQNYRGAVCLFRI